MQIDLKEFTFYEEWNDGYSYMLTIVDHFSGYPWAYPLFTKTASEVSFHLVNLFFMFGPPRYALLCKFLSSSLIFVGYCIQIMVANSLMP